MNKFSKTAVKLMAITQVLALTLLAACSSVGAARLGSTADTTTMSSICHATGDPANPYEEITLADDIYPVPVNGCPSSVAVINNGMITICHATGSETNPYKQITVSVNGLNGHGAHEGDIITSPEVGCPASLVVLGGNGTVSICHATDDAANPYEEITVNSAELKEHSAHSNDIMPAPTNGCPATSPVITSNGKITICHATGSKKNPYNEITISVNGLNGHGKHSGDIIPAPAGGCPTTGGNGNGNGNGNNGNGNGN